MKIKITASLVIDSIHSSLNELERSDDIRRFSCGTSERKLKSLELFLLCARKLGNNAQLRFEDGKVSTLGSLFQRIHHAIPCNWDRTIFWNFEDAISNLSKDIGRWYNTLLVSLPQPTFDEVLDIIDAVLENLYGIYHNLYYDKWRRSQPLEAMIEKITFLRNFIRFATLRSIEPRQLLDNLLVHVQAVAVDAAHTSYIYILQKTDVRPNVPLLLQMIKMVDTQVDDAYTQVLTSSKLSTKFLSPTPDKDHDPSVIMKDFVDSLLWNLWERLCADTRFVFSTNSELLLVYQGLGWLRSMLKEQPNKFDRRMGELTRVVICDAGITILSLYMTDVEIVVPTSCLLQKISRIRQRVEGKDLPIPNLLRKIHRERERGNDLPRTNELGFIHFVLENLLGMTSSKVCYSFQSQFQMIHDELSSLRYSLGKIEEVRNEQKDLEDLWNAGVQVAYRVEFLIDQLVFGDFQGSSSTSFDSTVEDILKEVKSINSNIRRASDIEAKKVSMIPNPVPSQNRAPVADEIVGFDDEITSIVHRLTRGSSQLKLVAMVGMTGIGKTTLATKAFNHPYVTLHFDIRLQCCVSQIFHKKQLLLKILKLVRYDYGANIEMSEDDVIRKLGYGLGDKRYLIFLDDLWDIEVWDSLKAYFPDDSCKSRILVTSRPRDAVPGTEIPDDDIFSMRLLTEDQSWELLRKKLPATIEWSPSLCQLGKQIAINCKGLPLTVVVVAGLLANTEPHGWNIFLESISSFSLSSHCMNVLGLSYKHLPGHLKECFLYFGLFPENYGVSVKRLIRLWIAEGFVRKTESKILEDTARDYLMDLVGRSLVIVSKKRSRGGVKVCRIHDLVHDFCRTKSNDENFFRLLKGGYDEFLTFPEPSYVRRLCVHSERKHFKNLRLFGPRLHSMLFFFGDKTPNDKPDISSIIRRYRRLRVLDYRVLDEYQEGVSIWSGFLSEIGLFLQLKYLLMSVMFVSDIPSSIGSLTNLETFILNSRTKEVSVPDTFWNLQKLRHVEMSGEIRGGFRLVFENLEKFPKLFELQSCFGLSIPRGESIERLVRKFPNIRELRCILTDKEIEPLKLDSLSKLESLHLNAWAAKWLLEWLPEINVEEFDFPGNLRKLSLDGLFLRQIDVSRIGKLPNLEVLKFRFVNFGTWEMVEGEFSTLRFLKLSYSKIVRWTAASDYQFPCLQKLVLKECNDLEEIPCYFKSITTLEMVKLKKCSDTVNSLFKGIQDVQTELRNSFLKIKSPNSDDSEDE